MFLKRFYDEPLAQASWMVGCQATGEAVVVDPLREIEPYIEAAKAEGLRITHVTETHIHADYVSGTRELAKRTGAQMYLSDEGGPDWTYGFGDEAILLKDGDHFMVGNIRIEAMHTPGHTPEHLIFLVTDTAAADEPMGAFTGDFVFVGDVGRPDLLEKAAKVADTMEAGARDLFRSLERFKAFSDFLQIWPGHGAGSACGKGLGAVPTSTLGYERRFNWGLSIDDEESFVKAVLEGQPEPPVYFAEMKRINRDGPRVLGGLPDPAKLDADALEGALDEGVVVDLRPADAFAGAHVPGTLNIPLNRSYTTHAGWLLPYEHPLYLIADDAHGARAAARNMATIGLDRVEGYFPASVISEWARKGESLETVGRMTPEELADAMDDIHLIDVRWQNEWDQGRIPGATHIHLGEIRERADEIPTDKPVVVHCASGGRSAIAAGVLQSVGVKEVINLDGGYNRWVKEGRPVEKETPVESAA
jgi:hydroxyacylglutathione hydrolase